MCMSIDRPSASVGSLSQFGPVCAPVSRKISWLMTPHSGLSMKRTERIVGIDGTAQGRMKINEMTLIHQRCWIRKPEITQRHDHLEIDGDDDEDDRVDDRAKEDRILEELDVARRMARQPEAVADRIEDEDEKDEDR